MFTIQTYREVDQWQREWIVEKLLTELEIIKGRTLSIFTCPRSYTRSL
jgi:hypothetical protein